MGSVSIWHWIVVGIVVMLLFGRGKISDLMGDVAKGIKSFKKGMADDEAEMGKPIRQDPALGRPNAVRELGVEGALKRLRSLAEEAIAAIPDCPGSGELEAIIRGESKRLVPRSLAVYAA
jgi:sec-independent protein translocase protein TatA